MTPLQPELAEDERTSPRSVLRKAALFSSFTVEEIEELALRAEPVRLLEGEVLFEEGDAGEHLYVILSGNVRFVSRTGGGLEHSIALLGPSSCFGEMALLDGQRRSATVVSTRTAELLRMGRETLERVFRRHPGARARFLEAGIRLLSARLRETNQRCWSLAGQSYRSRSGASQSRSRLISLVSHEFRTPLTIIKAIAQRLRLTASPAESPLVGKIEHQCGRLELLTGDLIALSMLQASSGLHLEEIDLAGLASEISGDLSKRIEEKRIRLVLEASSLPVMGDGSLLRRAYRHLLDNAVKAARPEGEIRVVAAPSGNRCRLSVRDDGPGLDSVQIERLSSSFVQVQDPLNRDSEGLGIGLALVTEVVKAHGGTLLVDSAPGSGSCFTIEIPRTPHNETSGGFEAPQPGRHRHD